MWNFPGTFYHYDIYKDLLSKIKPSIFYDGVNLCKWNGGRNLVYQFWDDKIVESYYKNNHRIALTFSNSIINLTDKIGNYLLSLLNKTNNYVICKNLKFAEYIKENFKNIKLIYSITGTELNYSYEWYSNTLKIFDYVVPRWHHIENIKKDFKDLSRFEILINHSCPSTCKLWSTHYKNVETENLNQKFYNSYDTNCINCLLKENLSDLIYSVQNTETKIKNIIKLGFSNFKLAGREFSKEQLCLELNKIKNYIMV